MRTVSCTVADMAHSLRMIALEITNGRQFHCTISVDDETNEELITCYNPRKDKVITVYTGHQVKSKLNSRRQTFFLNNEDVEDIESGSLWKLVGDLLVLVDEDRYFSVHIRDALGKFIKASHVPKQVSGM